MSFNKIIIVGNLGRDPELRYTPQGTAVCNFSMATTEKRRDKNGEMQDITTWFRITLWGRQAENASKYLQKGNAVYIEGRLKLDEWTDREGNTRQTLDVTATDMHFLSGSGRNEEMTAAAGSSQGTSNDFSTPSTESSSSDTDTGDDEIPF